MVLLQTVKTVKIQPSKAFPHLQYVNTFLEYTVTDNAVQQTFKYVISAFVIIVTKAQCVQLYSDMEGAMYIVYIMFTITS